MCCLERTLQRAFFYFGGAGLRRASGGGVYNPAFRCATMWNLIRGFLMLLRLVRYTRQDDQKTV